MSTMRTKITNTSSGPGSAHARWSMFGARGPLLNKEGEGGAGGGTSDPAATPAPSSGQPSGAVTPPPSSVTFTPEQQKEVNRIAAQAREDGRKAAIKPAEAPKPTTPAAPKSDLEQKIEDLELRNAFDKRAAKFGIDDDASERLFKLYKVERPENPGEWFETTAKQFGLKAGMSQPNVPNPAAPTDQKPPAAAPSSSQPAAVTPVTTGGLVDIYTMTPQQFAALTPAQIREHHEANVAAAQARAGGPRLPRVLQQKR